MNQPNPEPRTQNPELLPRHLGLILDGNRRWARARSLKPVEGHKKGADVFKDISLAAFERGIRYVSAYVFSTENWQRSKTEVAFLMRLVIKAVEDHLEDYHQKGIKIVIIGSREGLSKKVLSAIKKTEKKTSNNARGVLGLCFNYGGKQEIVDAVKSLMQSGVNAQNVTTETLQKYLYVPELPPLDAIIRTSGECRTSGYMLWRSDYAELIFVEKLWPDFTIDDLQACLAEYAQRQRRYGK